MKLIILMSIYASAIFSGELPVKFEREIIGACYSLIDRDEKYFNACVENQKNQKEDKINECLGRFKIDTDRAYCIGGITLGPKALWNVDSISSNYSSYMSLIDLARSANYYLAAERPEYLSNIDLPSGDDQVKHCISQFHHRGEVSLFKDGYIFRYSGSPKDERGFYLSVNNGRYFFNDSELNKTDLDKCNEKSPCTFEFLVDGIKTYFSFVGTQKNRQIIFHNSDQISAKSKIYPVVGSMNIRKISDDKTITFYTYLFHALLESFFDEQIILNDRFSLPYTYKDFEQKVYREKIEGVKICTNLLSSMSPLFKKNSSNVNNPNNVLNTVLCGYKEYSKERINPKIDNPCLDPSFWGKD